MSDRELACPKWRDRSIEGCMASPTLGFTEHQPADAFCLKPLLLCSLSVRREVLMVQEVPLPIGKQQWETKGLTLWAARQKREGCLASEQAKDL